jgi:hypothetical protein
LKQLHRRGRNWGRVSTPNSESVETPSLPALTHVLPPISPADLDLSVCPPMSSARANFVVEALQAALASAEPGGIS